MKRLLTFLLLNLCLLLLTSALHAQEDGLNLPADLYILLNSGTVERYGLGTAGVQTVTPESEYILDFSLAPDGNWLAYRTEAGITLQDLSPQELPSLALEGSSADVPPLRGLGQTMVWSPAGDALAYTTTYGIRVAFDVGGVTSFTVINVSPIQHLAWSPGGNYLAAEAEQDVWWVYQRSGTQMNLIGAIPSSFGTAWLTDAWLIFAPAEGGLRLLDFSNANQQTVLQNESRLYRLPYVRPDGSIAVFSRPANDNSLEPNTAFLHRLTISGTSVAVAETSETPIDLTSARWAPEAQILIVFQGGALALLLPDLGIGFPLPIANVVAYSWGVPRPVGVTGVSTNQTAFFRAPTVEGAVQVWRLPTGGLPPQPLTTATADITAYAVSASGNRLAYVSEDQLWLQELGTGVTSSAPVSLASVDSSALNLTFNPAGDTIAYSTMPSEDQPQSGIWTIPAAGGEPQLILPNEATFAYKNPQFAPNFNALLVERQTEALQEFFVYDPAAGDLLELGVFQEAAWLSDGRVIAHRWDAGTTSAEVYSIDISLSPINQALIFRAGSALIQALQQTGVDEVAVLLLGNNLPGRTHLTLEDVTISNGESQTNADFRYLVSPSISPDGSFIAGYILPDGALVIYNVTQGQMVLLNSVTNVTEFHWAAFR